MLGVMLAKSLGSTTMAFVTHVTAMPTETLRDFPALDLVLRGEPELTFREVIDLLHDKAGLPILIDETSLKDAMVDYSDPVTFKASKATVRTIFKTCFLPSEKICRGRNRCIALGRRARSARPARSASHA